MIDLFVILPDLIQDEVKYVTCGFQIGVISELALCSFIREGRVFENKGRRYQLYETFGQMSVRSFYAMAV